MSTQPIKIVNTDDDTEANATVSDGGELIVAQRTRLAGGVIGSTLAPWYTDSSSGGGSVVVTGGAAVIHSGVAAAGLGLLVSAHVARVVLPQANHCTVVAILGSLAAGGRYRFGPFDALNGFFFEILGGVARIVTRKAGVDTVITPPPPFLSVDTGRHVYTIRYLITRAHFLQDQDRKHQLISSVAGPLIQDPDLTVRVEAENLAAPGTDFIITVAPPSISRIGPPVNPTRSTVSRVATSTGSAQLAAANPLRRALVVFNDSNKNLYVKYGLVASETSFTRFLGSGDTLTIPGGEWTGRVDGILNGGSGFAQVTETLE